MGLGALELVVVQRGAAGGGSEAFPGVALHQVALWHSAWIGLGLVGLGWVGLSLVGLG